YFPSLELVMQGFTDPWESDMRHPEPYVLDTVMKVFEAAFCKGETSLEEAAHILRLFRAKNLRAISNRRVDTPEERALVNEAKTIKKASRQLRREAIAHQKAVGSTIDFQGKARKKEAGAGTEDAAAE